MSRRKSFVRSKWVQRTLLFVSLGGVCASAFVNCSSPTTPAGNSSNASQSVSAPLTVTPLAQSIAASSTLQLVASGGTKPYTYSILVGGGTVSSVGLFTAPSTADQTDVIVKDASGLQTMAEITTLPGASTVTPVTIVASMTSLQPGQTSSFTVAGGTPPYTLSLSGAGSLANNVFTATTAGASTITAVDSAGGMSSIGLNTVVVCGTVTHAGGENCHGGRNGACSTVVNFANEIPNGCRATNVHIDLRYFSGYAGQSCGNADSRDLSSAAATASGGGYSNGKSWNWSGQVNLAAKSLSLSSSASGWGDCGGNACNGCISDVRLTISTAAQ